MEDGRAGSHHRRGDEQRRVVRGVGQHHQAHQRGRHAHRQSERHGPLVGEQANHRLQQRGRELKREHDVADLRKVEAVCFLQQRKNREQERLQQIIEKVREAHRPQDRMDRAHINGGRRDARRSGHRRRRR